MRFLILRFLERKRPSQPGHDLAGEALGGYVHLFFGLIVDRDRAVFVQMERASGQVALFDLHRRKTEPARTDPDGDLLGAHLNDRVLRGIEAVGRCVGTE